MGTKIRRLIKPWHNEDLVITKWGLSNMRALLIVGFVLGVLFAESLCLILGLL